MHVLLLREIDRSGDYLTARNVRQPTILDMGQCPK
jgi:hypothetical protein